MESGFFILMKISAMVFSFEGCEYGRNGSRGPPGHEGKNFCLLRIAEITDLPPRSECLPRCTRTPAHSVRSTCKRALRSPRRRGSRSKPGTPGARPHSRRALPSLEPECSNNREGGPGTATAPRRGRFLRTLPPPTADPSASPPSKSGTTESGCRWGRHPPWRKDS